MAVSVEILTEHIVLPVSVNDVCFCIGVDIHTKKQKSDRAPRRPTSNGRKRAVRPLFKRPRPLNVSVCEQACTNESGARQQGSRHYSQRSAMAHDQTASVSFIVTGRNCTVSTGNDGTRKSKTSPMSQPSTWALSSADMIR